jgi:hypothetical protein
MNFETEVEHYVQAFIVSSNRVRYVVITITIASILLFAGHHNSADDGWFNQRLKLARTALHEQVWNASPAGARSEARESARAWFHQRGYQTEAELTDYIRTLEEARTEHILLMQMPFFGITFDVNDLGFFGGISLAILMLMLTFAMSRQHENLYLSLWKVRRVPDVAEGAQSKANLIYHTLAMSQQFSQPPSLARWQKSPFGSLSRILLFFPVLVQTYCLWHDYRTYSVGRIVSHDGAAGSLVLQGAAAILITILTFACLAYVRSNEIRWRKTFFQLNPALGPHTRKEQPSWLEWVQLQDPKAVYCRSFHPSLASAGKGEPKDPETGAGS